jgi:tetratricopeptide (TPR) repeat protein
MKRKLPYPRVEAIALFPKNLRFITEYSFSESHSFTIKVILTSAVSIFLLGLIFLQAVALLNTLKQQEVQFQQKQQLQNEVKYWEGVANKYQGYRDVYYRIGALQYKLGNTAESQKYVKKALELDPNFPEGHVLGAHVGLK